MSICQTDIDSETKMKKISFTKSILVVGSYMHKMLINIDKYDGNQPKRRRGNEIGLWP